MSVIDKKASGWDLAICQRLVRQLDGELQVQSSPGHGSRFTVVVPHGLPARRLGLAVTRVGFESADSRLAAAPAGAVGGG